VAISSAVFDFVYAQRSRNDGIGRSKYDQGMHGIKEKTISNRQTFMTAGKRYALG
jgi:hypothetical protein